MSTKTIHKLYWDYEKEERWLNEMAGRGLSLVSYRWGTYEFEKSAPGEWIYRIQFLDEDAHTQKSRDYIDFVTETGAEHVATYRQWVYFRRLATEGPFELFSDLDSRLSHYKRVATFYGAMTAILSMLMVTVLARIVGIIEDAFGELWGLPIFIVYLVLVLVFFTQTLRLNKRVKELKARRTIEE